MKGVVLVCAVIMALGVQPSGLGQERPSMAPAVKDVLDAWVGCAASAATRYASQPGDVGDLADAALGACEDQFSKLTAAMQQSDADTAQAAGDDAMFIAKVQQSDATTARRERSDLRARLMSLIIETRMRHTH